MPRGCKAGKIHLSSGKSYKKKKFYVKYLLTIVVGIAYPVLKSFFVQIHLRGELKTVKNLNRFQINNGGIQLYTG